LVIACGARPEPAVRGALTFRGPADTDHFRVLLDDLEAGSVLSLVFAVPEGTVWPLPLYELALLTAAYLEGRGVGDIELELITPEEEPLELFGREGSAAVRVLLEERGVAFRGRSVPLAFESGFVTTAAGARVMADAVVALPRLRGVVIEGLRQNREGFIAVDRHGRVPGVEGVYAAGDITSFPVKQGGLAAQQADAVAETIAAAAGAPITPHPFQPVLRGLLLTGGIPRYLRTSLTAGGTGTDVAVTPLWWPPAKITARRLGPFLAGHAIQPTPPDAIPIERDLDAMLDANAPNH
jgi:sulfide:quinone oxidoreductase